MPRRVDHDERREQIGDALIRVAARRGLHETGMREVAAEANVSVRLVQYYFTSKQRLLEYCLQRLAELAGQRIQQRLAALPVTASVVDRLEQAMLATLPLDPDRALLYIVYNQYFALSLTDTSLSNQTFTTDVNSLETWVAQQFAEAMDHPAEAATRAAALTSLTAGLGNAILARHRTIDEATSILRAQIDHRLR